MNNRELLELAAKAAGKIPNGYKGNKNFMDGVLDFWNPLNDNGDALGLAICLGIVIQPGGMDIRAVHDHRWDGDCCIEPLIKPRWENLQAAEEATRRAVVRAAAQIAESL